MAFTNINDPAGVSALLARLRESQAWSNIQTNAKASSETRQIRRQAEPPAQTQSVPSVADLLSQLSSPSAVPSTITSPNSTTSCSTDLSTSIQHGTSGSLTLQRSSSSRDNRNTQDVRALSFQQALPHIARLSEDPSFNKNINEMRSDQENLEKALWKERQALHDTHVEKVKTAVTKANITGTGISQREATVMQQIFEKELLQFDRERVIPAWDGLISRQQATLESLGVPTMFVTEFGLDKDRQQRVMQVLEGVITT